MSVFFWLDTNKYTYVMYLLQMSRNFASKQHKNYYKMYVTYYLDNRLECQMKHNTDLPCEGFQPQPVAHEGFWGVDLRQRKRAPLRISVPCCTLNNVGIYKCWNIKQCKKSPSPRIWYSMLVLVSLTVFTSVNWHA